MPYAANDGEYNTRCLINVKVPCKGEAVGRSVNQ
jgi:hypothetical protein